MRRAARPGPGSALSRLLGDTDPDEFPRVWGRRALLATAQQRGGDTAADLFGPAAVDELLSRRALRTPFLRMAKDGATLPESRFTAGGGTGAGIADQVDPDKVMRLFDQGATVVLQALHRSWPPLTDFTAALAADLGHPVQVNAYVTPAQNQGFSPHYDVHDVFVLQVHGRKEWTVHEPVHRAPLRDQPWTDRQQQVGAAAEGEPALRATLQPGDCLYLPRGFIHSARAEGGTSIHLTFGIHQWTRHHLAEELIGLARTRLRETEALRESLPPGTGATGEETVARELDRVRAALVEAVRAVPAEDLARVLQQRDRATARAAPVSPLAQLGAVSGVGPGTRLELRPHLALATGAPESGVVRVRSRAGAFRMPVALAGALDRLLEAGARGRAVTVAQLDPDPETARAAAKLFLRAGVAVVPDG